MDLVINKNWPPGIQKSCLGESPLKCALLQSCESQHARERRPTSSEWPEVRLEQKRLPSAQFADRVFSNPGKVGIDGRESLNQASLKNLARLIINRIEIHLFCNLE